MIVTGRNVLTFITREMLTFGFYLRLFYKVYGFP